ncbi:MAG: 16S rRNA (guanine(527)-N(7))-methyltransferase RsmG, partial [Nitrospiraceae bacterium]
CSSWMDTFVRGAAELGIELTEKHQSQFTIYMQELRRWNEKIDLTAITGETDIAIKHFLDSLVVLKTTSVTNGPCFLDIGSGAGFPGLPVKILLPEVPLTLLEPSEKKTAFLRHIIGSLRLSKAEVISRPIKEVAADPSFAGQYTHMLIRALALSHVAQWIRPLLTEGGRFVLWRTAKLDRNSVPRGFRIANEYSYELPLTHGKRVLVVLEPVPTTGVSA